jgi:hypothetical protein
MSTQKTILILSLIILITSICGTAFAGQIIHVDVNASPDGNGPRWDDAYTSLQPALSAASNGDEIWVAKGRYRPTTNTDRTISFVMKQGVGIYGGFAGTETSRDQRNWGANQTILSGDIGVQGDNSDNSYHVVVGVSGATLDGFIITGGVANGTRDGSSPYLEDKGGGMYNYEASPTVTNCTFSGNSANYGGGVDTGESSILTIANCIFSGNSANYGGGVNTGEGSILTIANCILSGNSASGGGGGMSYSGTQTYSYANVTNCIFINNSADGPFIGRGGGMFSPGPEGYAHADVTNCIFSGNWAFRDGGGIYNNGSLVITNCTFSSNSANSYGGGISGRSGVSDISNCILYNDTASSGGNEIALLCSPAGSPRADVNYSDIKGGQAGVYVDPCYGPYYILNWGPGNIDKDPCFVDANGLDDAIGTLDDNLRLLSGSLCIDAGDNNSVPPDYADLDGDGNTTEQTSLDLDGFDRFIDGDRNDSNIVDMGAYEFRCCLATNPNPVNNATGIPRTGTILSWTAGVGATGHDVYLDTVTPPVTKVSANQPGTTYAIPGTLLNKTKYYWRIDEKDICGTTTGTVWSFTTLCTGDFTGDGWVKSGDITALVSYWNNNKDGFGKAPCMP